MQLILNIVFFLAAVSFTVLIFLKKFEDKNAYFETLAIFFWIFFAVSMLVDGYLVYNIMKEKVIASKIYVYEEENKNLEAEIKTLQSSMEELQNLINESYKQSLEDLKEFVDDNTSTENNHNNTMHATSNQGSMDLTLSYYIKSPDVFIDLDTIYAKKIDLYNYNCKRINQLKEEKINTRIYKFLFNFGW